MKQTAISAKLAANSKRGLVLSQFFFIICIFLCEILLKLKVKKKKILNKF